ncbi:MAG: hypothetical protein PVI60_09590, partial [Desulfobacteraceae bacterium]
MRHLLFLMVLSTGLHLLSSPVYAHKVNVFAWVEGATVHTESKFSGGKKVKEGKIEVYDHLNRKVAEGVTDSQGYYAFLAPADAQTLKIVLTAGMGHSNHWQITSEELGHKPLEGKTIPAPPSPGKHVFTGVDAQSLEAIVERAVEKKLAPIKAQMAEQAWGLRDIVAG